MKQDILIWDLETAKAEHQHSPKLAEALIRLLPIDKPVIDFGCGKGTYLAALQKKGYECFGLEGTPGIKQIADFDNIMEWDLTKPWKSTYQGSVISLEVAEHIPAEHEKTFIETITGACDEWLVLSWAIKGQGGCGHHNEQDAAYVIRRIEERGFKYLELPSVILRQEGGKDCWWFSNSIYCFKRK